MTRPLLLLGPGGEYRRAWPEEDETMTTDQEHTPEPWEAAPPLRPQSAEAALDFGIFGVVDGANKIIVETFGQVAKTSFTPAKANAHRIVACVNACKGIADPPALRASHKRLLKACQAAQAYGDCLRNAWMEGEGKLVDGGGGVAQSDELDRGFDAWQAATDAALAEAPHGLPRSCIDGRVCGEEPDVTPNGETECRT